MKSSSDLPKNEPPSRMAELLAKRSPLKGALKFQEAIPLQLELIELRGQENADGNRLALDHNMASVLYFNTRQYSRAEWHGRQALALHSDESKKGHETRATYNYMMAKILAGRGELVEAVLFGRIAIAEYAHWHTPKDDFLSSVIAEVESMERRTWAAPE